MYLHFGDFTNAQCSDECAYTRTIALEMCIRSTRAERVWELRGTRGVRHTGKSATVRQGSIGQQIVDRADGK